MKIGESEGGKGKKGEEDGEIVVEGAMGGIWLGDGTRGMGVAKDYEDFIILTWIMQNRSEGGRS